MQERLACLTLDFELDYGSRIGAFNILREQRAEIDQLAALFNGLHVPISSFIVTHLLDDYAESIEVVQALSQDFHSHSHTHNTVDFDGTYEIPTTAAVFERHFGYRPLGYRAPRGALNDGDIDLLKQEGFAFSASIFPTIRPGVFNHVAKATQPFRHTNGLLEAPFATVPRIRYPISLSYLKLLGWNACHALFSTFGLPPFLIFDSHLHDYIVNDHSFARLPHHMQWAWGRNQHQGIIYFERFIGLLRTRGYRFVTMTQLVAHLQERGL